MSMMNSMSRMRGQEKGPGYTQTEAILGESMQRFGRELGEESNFGELQQRSTVHKVAHLSPSRTLEHCYEKCMSL